MTGSPRAEPQSRLPVIVIGAGGHATVLLDLLRLLGREVLFITDRDGRWHRRRIRDAEVRGVDELIFDFTPEQIRLVNAVGSTSQPFTRRDVYDRFRARGYTFDTLVHPTAVISEAAVLEAGVQVMAGAVVQTGARIGENTLLNTRVSIDHDCVIGSNTHIAPGVTLSGDVRVGDTTHIGTAATVIQGIRIGREAMIGAGAVVVRDVEDGQRVAGVPARPLGGGGTASRTGKGAEPFTVMLSAAGRRVALMRLLRQSVQEVGLRPSLLATDIVRNSAAFHLADVSRLVPRYSNPQCLEELLRLCAEMKVRLIVPTIDPDLAFYARHRERFEQIGTRIMVSSLQVIQICNDKKASHEWLVEQGLPAVRQIDAERLLADESGWRYPLFIKPRGGSSSIGAKVIHNADELRIASESEPCIVQEIAPGQEYTVDVYVDHAGRCRCAVPRLRIETRGGEVTKGMTVRCAAIQALAGRVAEALPGARGVMNIQIFYDSGTGALNVSEINPRFGGGYPLTHQAGAPMAKWMIEEATGRPLTAEPDAWRDGLVMLRFDEAVFVDAGAAGLAASEPEAASGGSAAGVGGQ